MSFEMPDYEIAIQDSISYLASNEAIRNIEANPYWPKWNSPWWHKSLLFEMDMTNRVPKKTPEKMLFEIKRTHLPFFFRESVLKNMPQLTHAFTG